MIEHVVVKTNEHAILRFADVDFVTIAAELERCAVGFERVFVRVLRRAAMTENVDALAALGDSLVAKFRFRGCFRRDAY
jgi:hypothetical protein